MPEGESLPKSGKSRDWLAYADSKLKEFRDYHGERNILGQIKNPGPLQDDYSKMLSQNELQARKMGMDLLRKESKSIDKLQNQIPGYRKGGRVKRSGPTKLHKGEIVVRKKTRKKTRSSSR